MKFRIWDNILKVFYYSEDNRICFVNEKPVVLNEQNDVISSNDCVCDRYTGYKDLNGVPIYERDIVEGLYGYEDGIGLVDENVFEHLRCLIECRVVANIHNDKHHEHSTS